MNHAQLGAFAAASSEWMDELATSLVDDLVGFENRVLSGHLASTSSVSDDESDDVSSVESDIDAYIDELVHERSSIRYKTTWAHVTTSPASYSWHGLPRNMVGQRYVSVLAGRW